MSQWLLHTIAISTSPLVSQKIKFSIVVYVFTTFPYKHTPYRACVEMASDCGKILLLEKANNDHLYWNCSLGAVSLTYKSQGIIKLKTTIYVYLMRAIQVDTPLGGLYIAKDKLSPISISPRIVFNECYDVYSCDRKQVVAFGKSLKR